jgi:hypothetical protein
LVGMDAGFREWAIRMGNQSAGGGTPCNAVTLAQKRLRALI